MQRVTYPRIGFVVRWCWVCIADIPGDDDGKSDAWFSDWVKISTVHRHHCTTAVYMRVDALNVSFYLLTGKSVELAYVRHGVYVLINNVRSFFLYFPYFNIQRKYMLLFSHGPPYRAIHTSTLTLKPFHRFFTDIQINIVTHIIRVINQNKELYSEAWETVHLKEIIDNLFVHRQVVEKQIENQTRKHD